MMIIEQEILGMTSLDSESSICGSAQYGNGFDGYSDLSVEYSANKSTDEVLARFVYLENKKMHLKEHALTCIEHDNNKALIANLNLSVEQVIDSYIEYDYDIFKFDNSIYDSIEMRVVMHLHNSLEGSWHIDRQNTVYEFIKAFRPASVMDIGFGIPSLFVRKFIEDQSVQITLSDFSDSSMIFASHLLSDWNVNWPAHVNLAVEDMSQTAIHPQKHDMYIFQDSIEHAPNPTDCLLKFVRNTHPEALFLFSLPIGPKIPVHSISWNTDQEIRDWLNFAGLKILLEKKVKVNPEVDLFAEQVNFSFVNLIVVCEKVTEVFPLSNFSV